MRKIQIPTSGKKEEKVLKIIDLFKDNKDIRKPKLEVKKEIVIEKQLLSEEKLIDLFSNLSSQELYMVLGKLKLKKSGPKNALIERLVNSPYNIETILDTLKSENIITLSKKLALRATGKKSDLIKRVIHHYSDLEIKESKIATRHLLDYYNELSAQDKRIYPQDTIEKINIMTMALDFERVTRYIFKNIFKLETKTQRFGKDDPDGTVLDDEGNIYYYECKTTLNPPYTLPISHRLQIRNYIQKISETRDKENFKGYIIIAHSYPDGIDKKLKEIKSPLDVPISVIEAKDLAAFAKKWEAEFPTDTFPIKQIVKKGKINLKDFEQILR